MRRPLCVVVLAALFSFVASARAGNPEPGYNDTLVVGGLSGGPTAVAFLPDGKMLITEKGGDLDLFDGATSTTLVNIPVCSGSEMGLLGVAVDPNFNSNGFIYLYRTKAGGGGCGTSVGRFNQIVRVTMSGGAVNLSSLVELVTGIVTDNGNHDGGVLRIGPDGLLWAGAGDSGNGDNVGGPGSATNPYAQDLGSLNGKVLRVNLDGTVPGDNPFVSTVGARGEVWAYGFRNPFRMSFDAMTGKLWIGDVGDLTVEEIDIGAAGGNYSWPRCEGDLQGPPGSPQPCVVGSDVAPVFTYPHGGSGSLGGCLIGGAFAGAAFGAQSGDYVFGDCDNSNVYLLAVNGTRDGFTGSAQLISSSAGTPADFVQGPDGAIYYTAIAAGEVRRLAAAQAGIDQRIGGKVVRLVDNATNPNRKVVVAVSRDTVIDLGGGASSSDDPTMNGASLRVASAAGGFDDTYPMPAANWTYIGNAVDGKGYRYKDPHQVSGPVKAAVLKPGRVLRVVARGAGLGHSLGVSPDPVDAVLQTGSKHYCMSAGGQTTFVAGKRFLGRDSPSPAACP